MRVLDLVRHGHAVATSATGDAGRILSEDGEAAVRALAERLRAEGWRPGVALSSPYTRARQTLGLLLRELPGAPPAATLAELATARDADELLAALEAALDGAPHAVAVGHMPLLGELVRRLAGAPLGFSPGTLVRLETEGRWAAGAARVTRVVHP
uniref:Phosphohistidine phosphatase SixA n=1 Tax=Eiseniibacteriota bacterium TaxID=2212470 RepID=A0A832I3B0_UNCEI